VISPGPDMLPVYAEVIPTVEAKFTVTPVMR
jgi:hypothetical protein